MKYESLLRFLIVLVLTSSTRKRIPCTEAQSCTKVGLWRCYNSGSKKCDFKTNNFSVCSSVLLAQGNAFVVQVYRVEQRRSYTIVLTKYTNTLCESNRILAPVNLRDYKRIYWLQKMDKGMVREWCG